MLNKSSLMKPNRKTKFRIDFDWWKSQDRNWRSSLISFLCPEHREAFAQFSDETMLDLVVNLNKHNCFLILHLHLEKYL